MYFAASPLPDLDDRAREIFRRIVDNYLISGMPSGSRTISRSFFSDRSSGGVSPASIRNIMADLEDLGLLYAPHTSAGRLPTERGLRLFVDALLEVGDIPEAERLLIKNQFEKTDTTINDCLSETSSLLSQLSHCASFVMAPTTDAPLEHVEFVRLDSTRILVVLVLSSGSVENRVIEAPLDFSPSILASASDYLNNHLRGIKLDEIRNFLERESLQIHQRLDEATSQLIESGLAFWGSQNSVELAARTLIVRGRSKLLDENASKTEMDHIRHLLNELETKKNIIDLLNSAEEAEGVRIFIGSENKLFSLSGFSLVIAPYSHESRMVGALGVIGPKRLNYARIIPMVNYMAHLLGEKLETERKKSASSG